MAITTITISGKIIKPDSTGAPGGKIHVSLASRTGTVDDAGTEQVVSPSFNVVIADDGNVNFSIIPTDIITVESGAASYVAVYTINDDESWTQIWQPTGVSNIDIGDLPIVITPFGDARLIVINDEADLPTPSAGFRQSVVYMTAGAGIADKYWRCMKDDLDVYDWILVSVG